MEGASLCFLFHKGEMRLTAEERETGGEGRPRKAEKQSGEGTSHLGCKEEMLKLVGVSERRETGTGLARQPCPAKALAAPGGPAGAVTSTPLPDGAPVWAPSHQLCRWICSLSLSQPPYTAPCTTPVLAGRHLCRGQPQPAPSDPGWGRSGREGVGEDLGALEKTPALSPVPCSCPPWGGALPWKGCTGKTWDLRGPCGPQGTR